MHYTLQLQLYNVLHVRLLDTKNNTIMVFVFTFLQFRQNGTTRGHSDASLFVERSNFIFSI